MPWIYASLQQQYYQTKTAHSSICCVVSSEANTMFLLLCNVYISFRSFKQCVANSICTTNCTYFTCIFHSLLFRIVELWNFVWQTSKQSVSPLCPILNALTFIWMTFLWSLRLYSLSIWISVSRTHDLCEAILLQIVWESIKDSRIHATKMLLLAFSWNSNSTTFLYYTYFWVLRNFHWISCRISLLRFAQFEFRIKFVATKQCRVHSFVV